MNMVQREDVESHSGLGHHVIEASEASQDRYLLTWKYSSSRVMERDPQALPCLEIHSWHLHCCSGVSPLHSGRFEG